MKNQSAPQPVGKSKNVVGASGRNLSKTIEPHLVLDFITGALETPVNETEQKQWLEQEEQAAHRFLEEFNEDWPEEAIQELVRSVLEQCPDVDLSLARARSFMLNAHIRLSLKALREQHGREALHDEAMINRIRASVIAEIAKF